MWHLRRVHMDSVGHVDARFDPLTLSFTDEEGEPASSVLWLENMGGKTSWLSLVFSVVRPPLREFLGRPKKHLGEYVLGRDTAHVILEFSQVTGARTLTGTGARLVVGEAMQWRQRRQEISREANQLDRRFWGAVLAPGESAESFFDRTVETLRTEAGQRVPLDAFVASLQERLDGDVFRPDNNQSKWTTWLANHGIDPTVFKYQMRMSEDEGSISETFQFDTGDELVQWALPYIVPPEVPDKIAGAVDGVRATLQRKPLLEAEHQFCRDIQERLTFAATQQSQLIYFRDEACRLWDEGLRVVDQMREAASQQRRASEHHATQARDFKAAADEAQHVRNQKQGQRRMAEYLLARLHHEDCQAKHQKAVEKAEELKGLVDAWGITEKLKDKAVKTARLSQLDEQLGEIDDRAAPKRRAVEKAARRLAGKLGQLLAAGREALASAEAEAADANRRREAARAEFQKQTKLLRGAQEDLAGAEARLDVLDQELKQAIEDGLVQRGQTVDEARDAASLGLKRAEAESARLAELEAEAQTTWERAREELDEAIKAEQQAHTEEQKATSRIERLSEEMTNLLDNPDVAKWFQTTEPDLWADGPPTIRRLREEAGRAAGELVSIEVSAAEDRRAVNSLERSGLLPPRVDVESVIAALGEAGIRSAYSGWEVLRNRVAPGQREAVISAHPDLVDGVLLADPAEMKAAVEAAQGLELTAPISLAPADALTSGRDTDQVVVLTGPAALYDQTAADHDKAQRQARLGGFEERKRELTEHQATVDSARASLEHFLRTNPATAVKEWREAAQEAVEKLAKGADRSERARTDLREVEAVVRETSEQHRAAVRRVDEWRQSYAQLERLRKSQGGRGELDVRVGAARGRVASLTAAVEQAEQDGQTASQQADAATERRMEAQTQIAGWERILESHGLAAGSVSEEFPESVDALERTYRDARADLEREAPPNEIVARREALAAEISEIDRYLHRQSSAVVEQAESLLATPEGADTASRERAKRQAEQRHADAIEQVGASKAALDEASHKLTDAESGDPTRRTDLDRKPTSVEEAEQMLELLSREAAEALQRMNEATERHEHHRREVERAEAAATSFQEAATDLVKVLGRYADELQRDGDLLGQRRVASAWPGDPGQASEERRQREDKLVEAGDLMRLAVEERNSSLERIRHHAQENRELVQAEMPTLMTRLTQGSVEQRGANAADLARRLDDRAVTIEKELEQVEVQRNILVDQLTSKVRETVRLLQRLQNRTALPDELEGWRGRTYLTLSHPPLPETTDQLKGRVDVVVEQICNQPDTTSTDGMALLYKAVSAGVAGPFTARILKPNKALKPNRVDISDMAAFSGGQKVTAALVMFAALTRMRTESHSGRQQTKAAVPLLLDNPIGKANQATLMEVQQRVAEAYGIQLIYTTGIHDIGALASFRNIIRLDGMEDTKTGRIHLREDAETSRAIRLGSIRLVQHSEDGQ